MSYAEQQQDKKLVMLIFVCLSGCLSTVVSVGENHSRDDQLNFLEQNAPVRVGAHKLKNESGQIDQINQKTSHNI